MADQETANVAVLAIGAGSPASSAYPFNTPTCGRDCSDTDDELLVTSNKEHGQYYTPAKLKENVQNLINQPPKKSEKIEEPRSLAETDSVADDMADIFISDEVLRQLRSNDKDADKKSLRLKRKTAKTQRKNVKSAAVNRKKELEINSKSAASGRNILKSAMRSKSSIPLEYDDDDPAEASDQEDKPKNNNWLASEDASVTLPIYIKNSSLSDLPFQSSDSICRICSMKNCSTHNVMGSRTTTDPLNQKEYSFKRADSSDDSGCFSNQSLQSINSPITGSQDQCEEDCSSQQDGQVSILTADHKSFPTNSCLCSACGNEPQGNGSDLCKTCIGRIKQEHARIGSIDYHRPIVALQAYANIIADSVKKILYISPKERKEVVHFTKERGDLNRKKSVNVSSPNMLNTQHQKSKTLSETAGKEVVHAKNLQNKSASFDERGDSKASEEVHRPSSVYWGSQEKLKVLSRSTTMSEIGEDKLRLVPGDVGDCASVDDDYFRAGEKDATVYQNLENDRDKLDRLDKSVKKSYTKQMSCMDRVRNDGDARPISQVVTLEKKNIRDDNTKAYSIQRSKSRIIQRTNAVEPEAKSFKTKEEDMNALNVFRLKVISEGSPVDPLNTVQKGKVDDLKDRRALLMRSATAPNKNFMQKKDSNAERKDSNVGMKTKRVNAKTSIVAQTSPEQPKEERMANVQSKAVAIYESPSESFRDDSSVNPFARRRSTSYDAKKAKPKKGERHRSISRPGTDRDDKNKKQRRQTVTSMDKSSGKKSSDGEKKFQTNAAPPQRYNYRSSEGNKTETATSVFPYQSRETLQDNIRYDGTESIGLEVTTGGVDALQASTFFNEDKIQPISSPSKASYYEGGDYYTSPANQSYSPRSEELHLAVCKQNVDTYYCEPEKSQDEFMDRQVMEFHDDSDEGRINEVVGDDEEDENDEEDGEDDDEDSGIEYHEDVQKYKSKETRSGRDSLWYDSHAGRRALMCQDRSHESKSSTSFHVVTTTKSSQSDEAIMRHSGSWELAPARRQSHMYSETDVDTGLMYHFAKRQTTRSHVPAYQDFTSASKDIYTMSGDVSTSSSSNSGISTKSEVSEFAYTGGFFKRDPFYENETQISSSSSSAESSSDQLYFESNNSTKREPSELDIYTGAIFSCSQNALSLGCVGEPNSGHPIDALKDGSTNNSTRPPVRHMSRRLRYRPHIDVIKFKSTDSISEFLSRSILPSSVDIALFNMSNNSSSWCVTDGSGDNSEPFEQETVVKFSENPTYTDYDPVAMPRPISPIKKVHASPSFDLLKYDRPEYVGTSPSSYRTPSAEASADPVEKWYDGYKQFQTHSSSKYPSRPMSPLQCTFPWQQADDYYTSSQRPKVNKSNNCTFEQADLDSNNNRLDDMYTGFFDVPPSRPYPHDQSAPNVRRTPSENWYAENPRRGNSPTGFYESTRSESPGRPYAADYESTEGAYSSSSVFGQASSTYGGTSNSPPYMSPRAFQEYERSQTSSSGFYEDESPRVRISSSPPRSSENMYGYFTYGSNPPMGDGGYMYEGMSSYDPYINPDSEATEIKKVGGIVIRENVVNKEDYAEDVNRDLEQGTWVPFNYRLEEKIRHPEEAANNRPDLLSEAHKLVGPMPGPRSDKGVKCFDDGLYQQNHMYDLEPRKNWREMPNKRLMSQDLSKKADKQETPAPHKAHAGGDSKKEFVKSTWNPPDQIPDRARGKRTIPKTTSVAGTDVSKNNSSPNVVSSVVSLPSRLTNYVRKFF